MTTKNDDTDSINPDPSDRDNNDDKDVVYTHDELTEILNRKLRGQGKALSEAKSKLAEYEKQIEEKAKADEEAKIKKLMEDGDLKGQLEHERSERQKLDNLLCELKKEKQSLQEREMQRIEELVGDNAKRLKALPKAYHDLVQDDDPYMMAKRLARAEEISMRDKPISVRIGGARGKEQLESEDAIEAAMNEISAAIDKRKT